ncbi:MAG TPA: glycosyltransferase [Pyrinomonadaceae bacterium]|nr:glycosyltransferase [Pyrinomonadaceae bacterium]
MVEKYPKNSVPKDPDSSSSPKVSILITTYNQENLITQAIESVLMQVTDFDCEIVIGEDASTDRTREVVMNLARQHPDKIRVLLRDPEVANRERHLLGKMNFLQALETCRGEYIAVLDGDDYFTNPHKLQKQVDFLDSRPDCIICFHNVKAVYEDGSKASENLCPADQQEITDIEQLLWGNFITSCSIMYRREPVVQIPDWFYTAKVGDWPLHIFKAQYGKIGYLNEVMAAYRVHTAGAWSLRKRSHQLLVSLKLLDNIDRDLLFKYHASIRGAKTRILFELAELYLQRGHSRLALIPVKRAMWCSRGRHKGILSLWLRLQTPGLYRRFTTLKKVARSLA